MAFPELTIGVTTWNSAPFLRACLEAIRATVGRRARVLVLDNMSNDGSEVVAAGAGAEVVRRGCSQPEALERLFALSRSRYTLLLHADVVMLDPNWLDICLDRLRDDVALVSPEDIGCGPYTRPWGAGMPESSFLLFDTAKARACRSWFRRQRFKIRWPYRALDFRGEHVTYNLPAALARQGYRMALMQVHPSPADLRPPYAPPFAPKYWREDLGRLRYGLGNFYSLDGVITHYHNWYDRAGALGDAGDAPARAEYPAEGGIPLLWLQDCGRRFLADWKAGAVRAPLASAAAAPAPTET
jgi:glycosyltransferase involved in cell wall biosynthesis